MFKAGTFNSEKQLAGAIQAFFEVPIHQCFILQCNSVLDATHILLCKSLLDQTRAEYIKVHSDSSPFPQKHLLIVLHLQRGLVSTDNERWQFNFQSGWGQVTIDTMEKLEGVPLSTLLTSSMTDLLSSELFSVKQHVRDSIKWALLCLKYPNSKISLERIILYYPSCSILFF